MLKKIINPLKWMEFEKISAYYVEHGVINTCVDKEAEAVDNAVIDGASDEINTDYEEMVKLLYESRVEVE